MKLYQAFLLSLTFSALNLATASEDDCNFSREYWNGSACMCDGKRNWEGTAEECTPVNGKTPICYKNEIWSTKTKECECDSEKDWTYNEKTEECEPIINFPICNANERYDIVKKECDCTSGYIPQDNKNQSAEWLCVPCKDKTCQPQCQTKFGRDTTCERYDQALAKAIHHIEGDLMDLEMQEMGEQYLNDRKVLLERHDAAAKLPMALRDDCRACWKNATDEQIADAKAKFPPELSYEEKMKQAQENYKAAKEAADEEETDNDELEKLVEKENTKYYLGIATCDQLTDALNNPKNAKCKKASPEATCDKSKITCSEMVDMFNQKQAAGTDATCQCL